MILNGSRYWYWYWYVSLLPEVLLVISVHTELINRLTAVTKFETNYVRIELFGFLLYSRVGHFFRI